MPLPEREYFTLNTLARRWHRPVDDVEHFAETRKMRCSVWIKETWIELGKLVKLPNGKEEFIPEKSVYVKGFVGLRAEDCRLLFRNKKVVCTIFASLKEPGLYLRIADKNRRRIHLKPKDVVVHISDRDKFEREHHWEYQTTLETKVTALHETPANYNHLCTEDFSHNHDYTIVTIRSEIFRLGRIQAKAVRLLHNALIDGTVWLNGKILLYEAGSTSQCMRSLFKSKKNWRNLIDSDGAGNYRLNLE